MEAEPSPVPAGGRADKLSSLSDGVLGHILSFLPAAEAARAAALSRRWRHVFAAVHTVSLREPKRPDTDDDPYDRYDWSPGWGPDDDDSAPKPAPAQPFVNVVGAALHGRHRGAHAPTAPLRALRVAFDEFDAADAASATAVDGWLAYAAHQGAAATGDNGLRVDMRFGHPPLCGREYALRGRRRPKARYLPEPEAPGYAVPRGLFSCAALRALRLASCRLDPPAGIALPSLDTLHLTRVAGVGEAGADDAVQRLVSACPRLADLTLEACAGLASLSVPGTRLRRLALRCCHDLAAVAAHSPELRAFEYAGAIPEPSFLTMPGRRRVTSCALNFCGEEAADPAERDRLRDFLRLFAGVTHLHVKCARLVSGVEFPVCLPALRRLELTGMLPKDDDATVAAVTKILRRTPRLEALSLFFLPEPEEEECKRYCYHEDELRAAHKLGYTWHEALAVPACGEGIPSLRERTREINLVHYQGGTAQRTLAKLLLRNAMVVDEVYCELAPGPLWIQTQLMEEIRGWVMNKSANMTFF